MKAIGIFSGGLDSLLATRLLQDQGITPTLVTFTTPFFDLAKAQEGAEQLGLPLTLIDVYEDLLSLVRNPIHGLGRNLNPCIDCHTMMFRKAGELLGNSPGFLYSGEVVGQRPMSQNARAMKSVAEDSGHAELILRPLSAKILNATVAEKEGWVDREKLLGLSGRVRRPQMDLANQYGFKIPTPAGGCLLTDQNYSFRFRWLMGQDKANAAWPPARLAELIKRGRIFTVEPGQWVLVGRNQSDNQFLQNLSLEGDTLFHLEGAPGPTVLCPFPNPSPRTMDLGRALAVAYGDHGDAEVASVRVKIMNQALDSESSPSTLEPTPITTPDCWEQHMVK